MKFIRFEYSFIITAAVLAASIFTGCRQPETGDPSIVYVQATQRLIVGEENTFAVSCEATPVEGHGQIETVTVDLSALGDNDTKSLSLADNGAWIWTGAVAPPETGEKTIQFIVRDSMEGHAQQSVTVRVYAAADYPALELGVRFIDNNDGTVTDNRTKLVWLKNADSYAASNWYDAAAYCARLKNGTAGLTDGSVAGQWYMPTKWELEGLGTDPPTMWDYGAPATDWTRPGLPFTNVRSNGYWSSTPCLEQPRRAWIIGMDSGYSEFDKKSGIDFYTFYFSVWPVRSGNQ